MLKFAGVILILLSATAMGISRSYELTCGLRALEEFMQMTLYLKGEIRYKNASLSDALTGVSMKMSGLYGAFLKKTAKDIKDQRSISFGLLYRENAENFFDELPLSKEERERICSLGDHLGYLDRQVQIGELELFEKELEDIIRTRRRELPEKKKVYHSLGVLLGILLAVLLM